MVDSRSEFVPNKVVGERELGPRRGLDEKLAWCSLVKDIARNQLIATYLPSLITSIVCSKDVLRR